MTGEQVENKVCKHPEDTWTNYCCGDCGDYMHGNGCRRAQGLQIDAIDTACIATIHHDENGKKFVFLEDYQELAHKCTERIKQLKIKNAALTNQLELTVLSRSKTERLKKENKDLRLLMFAFVRNSAVLPVGLKLGKSEQEIADKTFETIAEAMKMLDVEKMRASMNLATDKENRYDET